MIATVAYPDEIILMSDSRVTFYSSKIPPKDSLKKVYQLNKHLMLAFTSEDVAFTWKIIEKMTIKASELANEKFSDFLEKISDYAKDEYLKHPGKKPVMEFIYAGLDFDSKLKVESRKLAIVLRQCAKRGYYPNKLIGVTPSKSKLTSIPGPVPILAKQSFPNGEIIVTKGWNMGTAGSGQSFIKELETYYPKIFHFPGSFNKGVILKNLADDYIKREKISTVGGFVQLFTITEQGIAPLQFLESKNGKETKKSYIDGHGNWIEEDLETGKKNIIVQNI